MSQTLEALVVELRADVKGLQTSLQSAAGDVQRFSNSASSSIKGFQASVLLARTAIVAMGAAFVAFKVGKGIVDAGVQVQALGYRMNAATGDAKIATEALAFVRAESERLGLSFLDSANSFASFSASALRSGMTFQQTKEVFTGVAEAVTALHLPADRAQSAFLAIEQMASKGTVQMQELKLQLASAIPGAMEIMAQASGKSVQEFNALIGKGEVLSSDALPKLARAFRDQFGKQATEAAEGAQAAFNRLGNALLELQSKLANSGILDVVVESVRDLTKALNDPAMVDGLVKFAQALAAIAKIALDVASGIGQALYKIGEFETKALALVGLGAGAHPQTGKIRIPVQPHVDPSASGSYSLGGIPAPAESEAQQKAREKAERMRQQLRDKVSAIGLTNARENDPGEAAALEVDKQLKTLKEALDKKAITESEYRDASIAAEMAYQDRLTDIRKEATDLEVSMRGKALNSIQGLMQVFAGKNKAIAIAMLAFDKARAIAQAIMETHVAAAAALKYDPTGATSAYVTTLGYANVAAIAATGIAQLATMGSGGGSGGDGGFSGGDSLGGGGGGTSSVAASQKVIQVTLQGSETAQMSKNQVRDLIDLINDAQKDGSRVQVMNA
ncbi:tape measure protein [Mesorhizobium sp. ES1-1]|uniref:tape measure protein n=1 Tax=Mesorhizobium sp. ES1-1 TaxID=2876629 RepID=UPI001CC967A4|nr:tape measure protein [Mesorhizobium sp. ES1-1]MBZ9674556.1 tape measure protein [Mesorhizobium sp. ES1-1]